jgi:hypothetical protein
MKTMLIAILAVGLLLFGCAGNGGQPPNANPQTGTGGPTGQLGTAPSANDTGGAGVKFFDTKYGGTAVEVYPGTTSGASSAEVSGFEMSQSQQADGSVTITMTEKAGGQTLSATVPKGGKLYFNDANPGDDTTGQDKFLQDDTLIVVDSNGYIVGQ